MARFCGQNSRVFLRVFLRGFSKVNISPSRVFPPGFPPRVEISGISNLSATVTFQYSTATATCHSMMIHHSSHSSAIRFYDLIVVPITTVTVTHTTTHATTSHFPSSHIGLTSLQELKFNHERHSPAYQR